MTDRETAWIYGIEENSQEFNEISSRSLRIRVCTVHNEIGRQLMPAGKVFRDTRVRSSMGRLDGSYAEYGATSAQIHDRDSGVRRDRMTV